MKDRYDKLISLGAMYSILAEVASDRDVCVNLDDLAMMTDILNGEVDILNDYDLVEYLIRMDALQDLLNDWYSVNPDDMPE